MTGIEKNCEESIWLLCRVLFFCQDTKKSLTFRFWRNQAADDQRAPAGIRAADRSEERSLQRLQGSKTGNAGVVEGQTERGAVLRG